MARLQWGMPISEAERKRGRTECSLDVTDNKERLFFSGIKIGVKLEMGLGNPWLYKSRRWWGKRGERMTRMSFHFSSFLNSSHVKQIRNLIWISRWALCFTRRLVSYVSARWDRENFNLLWHQAFRQAGERSIIPNSGHWKIRLFAKMPLIRFLDNS